MRDPDQLLKKIYKSEADEVLFQGLNFDTRMKEEFMRSLHPPLKRIAPNRWFNRYRLKWIYGSMTAVAAVLVLIIALPMLNNPPTSSTPPIDSATPLTTFVDGGPSSSQKWKLPNVADAQAAYGEGLYLPSYTPDAYVNNNIDAYGSTINDVNRLVFSYTSDNGSYDLIVEKKGSLEPVVNDEKIKINEVTGYIHSDEPIGTTTLFWVLDDNLYSITGKLPREEAIRVAQSIQP